MVRADQAGATPALTEYLPKNLYWKHGAQRDGLQLVLLYCKGMSRTNPRHQNGNLRRKHRARLRAMAAPCGICGGRLGPIHYDEPSDAQHPLSFVIDEIRPVSRWKEFGYESPAAAAQDWDNLQAAHWCCNAAKSNKINVNDRREIIKKINFSDGDW